MVTIRDALWDTIRVGPEAMRIVDSAPFQRLRHIRQLGHAYLVYPGATHTRFDHALGVYHLASRALNALAGSGNLEGVPADECALIPFAALLHDIGHYPFSHALEELEAQTLPGHHEAIGERLLREPAIADVLEQVAPDGARRVGLLIRGRSPSPLQGLVAGSLDLDKIEYLKRDARFCGVPYGEVDVDRLLAGLMVLRDPGTGRLEVGVHEKGVAALESLLFAKYQMFRNVYWHHAVRAATVLYKRVVAEALREGLLHATELVGATDEALLFLLEARAAQARAARVATWTADLRARRLPKRAAETVAADLDGAGSGWLETESPLKRRVEDALAAELGLAAGTVYLDFPVKGAMFALDLLVKRRDGTVLRVGPGGQAGLIGLPRIADELYRTARVLRLYTHGERRSVRPDRLMALARQSGAEVEARLEAGTALLDG
jgi:uncharacterized protein